jgi:flotillin
MMKMKNEYLEQVVAQQANLQRNLKRRSSATPESVGEMNGVPVEALAGPIIDVKVTGLYCWKTVIVPPNAYVVHTRRDSDSPLHLGMGVSFRYNPFKDAYLVVPATTQTIVLSANCICKERQGILVQGYVQWIIHDFEKAYTKLDFSDRYDPMRIVNTQLQEQAEATIKDTVATMSIDDVLSDKQPIISELTRRLREVTEGGDGQEGLGLRIVTVQIKEAVVSSASLWETLQRPFRAERSKDARIAELENQTIVQEREAKADAVIFDREEKEKLRRVKIEAENLEAALVSEQSKIEKEAELEKRRLQVRIQQQDLENAAQLRYQEQEIKLDEKRQKVANDLSNERLRMKLIDALPEIAERMPKPDELRNISINGDDSMGALLTGIMQIVDKIGASKEKNITRTSAKKTKQK